MKKLFFYMVLVLCSITLPNDSKDVNMFEFVSIGERVASWYGPGFHGRKTANGEIYNMNEFTAAHKQMKFNTFLRLTNPENDKSVIVRINDRGPYIRGRSLDLSKAAAKELDMIAKGVVKLNVEIININLDDFPIITLN